MTADEAKLCRTGRDPERPSVVYLHHRWGITGCERCGAVAPGAESMRAGLEQSRKEAEKRLARVVTPPNPR